MTENQRMEHHVQRMVGFLTRGLKLHGAAQRTMDLGDFAAGRSQAVLVLSALERGEQLCTADAPFDPALGDRARHPDAVDDGECGDCCCDWFRCPHCGLRFRVGAGR